LSAASGVDAMSKMKPRMRRFMSAPSYISGVGPSGSGPEHIRKA
jgi:hypothetical protein